VNIKRISKTIAQALASASFFAALGGIAPGFAAQVAGHDAPSAATAAAGSERPDSLAPKNQAAGDWTCPMHPEIHHHEAGKCPVCKMKLIKTKPGNT